MSTKTRGCFTLFGEIECAKHFIVGFPPAGGNPTGTFQAWEAHLPDHVCVLGYCPPGRGLRTREAAWTSFEDVIQEVVSGMLDVFLSRDGPAPARILLYGHSLGALVAFGTASYLEAHPEIAEAISMPEAVVCVAKNAPLNSTFQLPAADGSDQLLSDWLISMQGGSVLQDPDFMAYFLTLLRADLVVHEDFYRRSSEIRAEKLRLIPLCYHGGTEDGFSKESQLQWSECSVTPVSVTWWEGGHFFMNKRLSSFVATVVATFTSDHSRFDPSK